MDGETLRKRFKIGREEPHVVDVELGLYGLETIRVDGREVLHRVNPGTKTVFEVGNRKRHQITLNRDPSGRRVELWVDGKQINPAFMDLQPLIEKDRELALSALDTVTRRRRLAARGGLRMWLGAALLVAGFLCVGAWVALKEMPPWMLVAGAAALANGAMTLIERRRPLKFYVKYPVLIGVIGGALLVYRSVEGGRVQRISETISAADQACRNGDFRKAVEDYSKAIELSPREAALYLLRGQAWLKREDPEKALADFTRAVEISPQDAVARQIRGVAYFNRGNFDEAISDFAVAIRVDPRAPEAYVGRGQARASKGDAAGAARDLEKALELAPAGWGDRSAVEARLKELRSQP